MSGYVRFGQVSLGNSSICVVRSGYDTLIQVMTVYVRLGHVRSGCQVMSGNVRLIPVSSK